VVVDFRPRDYPRHNQASGSDTRSKVQDEGIYALQVGNLQMTSRRKSLP
jgi:hypothetical protein